MHRAVVKRMSLPLPVLSAWDPRATSAGSIDPLGALRAYTAIAQYLVPGATTITTRVRYLSWLCAGLCLLDEVPGAPSGGTAGRSRRQRLLPWERLLALATGYYAFAAQRPSDSAEWRGLRGISYVQRAISQERTTTEFELLRNQAGVGGIGTYWVTLVNGGLVENLSAELTPRGRQLAEAFLKPISLKERTLFRRVLGAETPTFDRAQLERWGEHFSLNVDCASKQEAQILRDALLEPSTQRRLFDAIAESTLMASSHRAFRDMARRLSGQRDELATSMSEVMKLTRAFEVAHAGMLDRLDRLLALNSLGEPIARSTAAQSLEGYESLSSKADTLQRQLDSLREVPGEVATPVRQFLTNTRPILDAEPGDRLLSELCRHHERVQGGKLDAARQPKQPWVALQGDNVIVSPAFAHESLPNPRDQDEFTHAYRIESFAGMLNELADEEQAA